MTVRPHLIHGTPVFARQLQQTTACKGICIKIDNLSLLAFGSTRRFQFMENRRRMNISSKVHNAHAFALSTPTLTLPRLHVMINTSCDQLVFFAVAFSDGTRVHF